MADPWGHFCTGDRSREQSWERAGSLAAAPIVKPRASPSKCRDSEDAHTSHQLGSRAYGRQVTVLGHVCICGMVPPRDSLSFQWITGSSGSQPQASGMCLILLWFTSPLSRASYSSGLALWNKLEFFNVCYVSLVLFLRQRAIYRVLTVDHTDLKLPEIHLLLSIKCWD